MRGKKRLRRLSLAAGLPEDALTSGARVTMLGRGCVMVDGQRGVVELSAARIRLMTDDGVLCVCGTGLELVELSAEAAMIGGSRIDLAAYGKAE